MKASEQAFKRLENANPLTDHTAHHPTLADAYAFTRSLEGGTVTTQDLTKQSQDPQERPRRWLICAAAFAVVLLFGAALALFAGDGSTPVASPSSSLTDQTQQDIPIDEPAALAAVRTAVNDGDAVAAAAIHGEEGTCDRFLTEGFESCLDWYSFLVGIGINVSAADCIADSNAENTDIRCHWTLGSDAHRALGIDTVDWAFSGVSIDGWDTTFPDGNFFGGHIGLSAIDESFWAAVTNTLEGRQLATGEASATPSLRVPATLNAELAVIVLEEAETFISP